jgi:tRNA dimethylallyltransferase
MLKKTLHIIAGPTAIGKTAYAIERALALNCPIISADSRQIYRELSIGVAKPSKEELNLVKHYFIDHCSIHDNYNAGQYAVDSRLLINELFETFNDIVICGGTGLYINALIKGLDPLPPQNPELRQRLQSQFETHGIEVLQSELKQLSESTFQTIDQNNPQRMIRAIEICLSTPISNTILPKFKHEFEVNKVVLEMDRDSLYSRIDNRVDQMIEAGLEQEVINLMPLKDLNALQTVGYKEWWPYFEGHYSKEQAIEKIKQHSRNYAKRQITWFKHQF